MPTSRLNIRPPTKHLNCWGLAPGNRRLLSMSTYLIMATRIADEIVRDDLASQIRNAINDAIKTWEGLRFTFNERKYLIQTVADQEYYDLVSPTLLLYDESAVGTGEKLLEIDNISATVNNSFYSLTPRTQQWFTRNAAPASQYTGQPDSYTIFNDQLRLFPVPADVYDINLDGLARLSPNPLSADADTNAWMVEGEQLIRAQAKYLIYRDIIRDGEGKALAAEGLQEAQWQLERKAAGKLYTGTQTAWTLCATPTPSPLKSGRLTVLTGRTLPPKPKASTASPANTRRSQTSSSMAPTLPWTATR